MFCSQGSWLSDLASLDILILGAAPVNQAHRRMDHTQFNGLAGRIPVKT
jgi:hypothetical protein